MATQYAPSELILNPDGSVFHLHLLPEQLADKIILVGDPARVNLVASHFEHVECDVSNREFHTITGSYNGKRITALSHGIGTDNIDIVINELDALANIDLKKRIQQPHFRPLELVRIGTSGGLQPNLPIGSYVIAQHSIGFDGVLHFYANGETIRDLPFEEAFKKHTDWSPLHATPYVVEADDSLVNRIDQGDMVRGVTLSANGFYGPQGRELRLPLADPHLNQKIESFRYGEEIITNYEMESSALAALAALMGHKAMTVCAIIANRVAKDAQVRYGDFISELIVRVLDRI